MSKAILVMDMPKSCKECRFSGYDGDICCLVNKDISFEEYDEEKPFWCPLRKVPEKKDRVYERPCLSYGEGWDKGYNACIDDISGKDDAPR